MATIKSTDESFDKLVITNLSKLSSVDLIVAIGVLYKFILFIQ